MLVKDKLNTIEVLISKALIDSFISHDEFASVNNVLREYYEMKQKNEKFTNFYGIHYIKTTKTYCFSCKKYTANENSNFRKLNKSRLILLSNCAVCSKKKSTFIKNKEGDSTPDD